MTGLHSLTSLGSQSRDCDPSNIRKTLRFLYGRTRLRTETHKTENVDEYAEYREASKGWCLFYGVVSVLSLKGVAPAQSDFARIAITLEYKSNILPLV